MAFELYDSAAPVFADALRNMRAWLDKAEQAGSPEQLIGARLAEDMRPLSAQYQMASDVAKNAMGRLTGTDAPAMPDTETTFDQLRERCDRTIAYVESIPRSALADAESREVTIKFPNGTGFRWQGGDYLRRFALPNFYFHVTTAYAILRAHGVPLGKPDFLQHLGPPNLG